MTIPAGTIASRAKANTTKRQKLKTKWDRSCRYEVGDIDQTPKQFSLDGGNFEVKTLNATEKENWCRLLDEGVVVDNNFFTGEPMAYAVIRKGVIKQWYDSLPDDYVGYINKDHNRSIDLGSFTKEDLRLVELDNGRYAVDVNVKLDQELFAVKDLLRMKNRTALSVEMFVNAEEYATAEKVTGDKSQGNYLVPLLDELKIEGYAVCLAPKSANSYKDDLLENAGATDNNENLERKFDMNEDEIKVDAPIEETPAVEETPAEAPEAPAEDVEDKVEASAEETAEDVEAPAEDAEAPAEADEPEEADDEVEASIDKIGEKIEALQAEIKAKDAKIAELEAKLSAKETKKLSLAAKLEGLLNFAEADVPTEAEGKATTTENEDGKDDYSAALENAFKEM